MKNLIFLLSLLLISLSTYPQKSYINRTSFQISIEEAMEKGSCQWYNTKMKGDTIMSRCYSGDTSFFYYFVKDTCVLYRRLIHFVDFIYVYYEDAYQCGSYEMPLFTPRSPVEIKVMLEGKQSISETRRFIKEYKKETYIPYVKAKKKERIRIMRMGDCEKVEIAQFIEKYHIKYKLSR